MFKAMDALLLQFAGGDLCALAAQHAGLGSMASTAVRQEFVVAFLTYQLVTTEQVEAALQDGMTLNTDEPRTVVMDVI